MPQALLRKGLLSQLSGTAVKLFTVICHDSERYCTRRLTRTTVELKSQVGCSRNSLIKARADLVNLGLVKIEINIRQEFVIELCDPETGKPWPGDPKQVPKYQKRSSKGGDARAAEVSAHQMESKHEDERRPEQQTAQRSSQPQRPVLTNQLKRSQPPNTPIMVSEQIDRTCDADLSGTAFPFGFNAPSPPISSSGATMDSLRGMFDDWR